MKFICLTVKIIKINCLVHRNITSWDFFIRLWLKLIFQEIKSLSLDKLGHEILGEGFVSLKIWKKFIALGWPIIFVVFVSFYEKYNSRMDLNGSPSFACTHGMCAWRTMTVCFHILFPIFQELFFPWRK